MYANKSPQTKHFFLIKVQNLNSEKKIWHKNSTYINDTAAIEFEIMDFY